MNCPGCHKPVTEDVCPLCGFDIVLFTKTLALSNACYNKGLACAKHDDLTSALAWLRRSVAFNRKNMLAQNLLGLVYCTTGRIGEALKHWVISVSYQPKENAADTYMVWFQDNQRKLEDMTEAGRLYNQALVYAYQKSEDMAVIGLKKAVDLSPDFVEAHCLLALCYIAMKDKNHALTHVERALAKDAGNVAAWRYYHEIGQARAASEAKKQPVADVKTEKQAIYPAYGGDTKKFLTGGLPISGIICFVVGAICAVALMYVLYMPQQIRDHEETLAELQAQMTDAKTSYENRLADEAAANAALKAERDTLVARADGQETENAALANEKLVYEALSIYHRETVKDEMDMDVLKTAIDKLGMVDAQILPNDAAVLCAFIEQTVRPILAQAFYDQGLAHYTAQAFEEGAAALDKAVRYAPEDFELLSDAHYHLGLIAEALGNNGQAIAHYEKVAEESNRYAAAQTRLSALAE